MKASILKLTGELSYYVIKAQEYCCTLLAMNQDSLGFDDICGTFHIKIQPKTHLGSVAFGIPMVHCPCCGAKVVIEVLNDPKKRKE